MHLKVKKLSSLGEGLHLTGRLMRELLVESLHEVGYDYPVEFYPTLKFLTAEPKATQDAIASYLLRDKATVARLLSRMEKEKLVKRSIDPSNRRQKLVELTSKGECAFKEAFSRACQLTERAVEGISEKDQKTCQHVLQRVFANLNTND